jgi:putative endonuclease
MTPHQQTGNFGEALAVNFLIAKGFTILHTNWRFKKTEVDIIAVNNQILHFVEVKTRTQTQFGLPEDSIDAKKMNALKKAAVGFLEAYTQYLLLQFDVVSILLQPPQPPEIFYIEDVFF